MPTPIKFMGTRLALAGKAEVLALIDAGGPARIATPNPEFMLEAQENPAFRSALEGMDCCIVDGSGLYFGLRLQQLLRGGNNAPGQYAGADLCADLFARYRDGSRSFYLLGGKDGLAAAAVPRILAIYPGVKIVGAEGGGLIGRDGTTVDASLSIRIKAAKPNILLIGFGAPRQELWITQNAPDLAVQVMVGVGGTFGFYTDKKRAPRLLRSLHIEWLYRGATESGHWRRVWRATVVFGWRTASWLLSHSDQS